MKKYYKYFIYISLIFLLIALYQADYLIMPKIYSFSFVIISIFLLFAGFIFDAITWMKTLQSMSYKLSFKNALISYGLSIFGKYIPGKIWLIAGRSAYISKKYDYSEKDLLVVSVITQLISLWVGLIFGITGLFFLEKFLLIGSIAILFWIILTIVIFFKFPHRFFLSVINRIFKKKLDIPYISFKQLIKVIHWYILRWFILSLSFYLLVNGLTENSAELYIGLAYPLAGTLALAVIFVPGGLGIREGLLVTFFKGSNFSLYVSTSISITSRLWFLIGEIFIFITAVILSRLSKNTDNDSNK